MSFLKAQVSFSSNFPSIFSAIKYNSSVLSQLKNEILLSKKSPFKCKFLRLLTTRVKIRQIAMSILKRQVNSSPNFASFFIFMILKLYVNFKLIHFLSALEKRIPSKIQIFISCIFLFGEKDPIKVPTLTLSSALVKICQIPHFVFQTTSQFFYKFCITLQCYVR